MSVIDTVKQHPYLTAGGVFVGGVLIVVIMSSGTKTEEVTADNMQLGGYTPVGADSTANSMLAQSQISGQVASHIADNQLKAQQDDNATAFMLASKQFEFQNNSNILTSQVALANVNADIAINASNNGVSTAQVTADLEKVRSNNGTAATIALGGYDRDKYVASAAERVNSLQITSEADVAKSVSYNNTLGLASINSDLIKYLNDHAKAINPLSIPPVSAPVPVSTPAATGAVASSGAGFYVPVSIGGAQNGVGTGTVLNTATGKIESTQTAYFAAVGAAKQPGYVATAANTANLNALKALQQLGQNARVNNMNRGGR